VRPLSPSLPLPRLEQLLTLVPAARSRMGDYARAHQVYTQGCAVKGLDYPEFLLEAWLTFENEYGVLADVDFALVKAKRQRKGLEKRRARVRHELSLRLGVTSLSGAHADTSSRRAQEAADAAAKAAAAAPAPDTDSFISSAVAQDPAQDGTDASKKRERSPQDESAPAQGAKKVRVEAPEPAGEPKRCVSSLSSLLPSPPCTSC